MIAIGFPHTATLVTRIKSGTDGMGNDVFVEDTQTIQGVYNPGTSAELVQGQDVVTTQPTFYTLENVNVAVIDAIDIDGQRFEVDGSPNQWTSPFTGERMPTEIKLRRVTG